MNIVLAGLGQVLMRGTADDAQCLVDQLLRSPVTRNWIVGVCTCAYYRDCAFRYVASAMDEDKSLKEFDQMGCAV